MRNLPEEDWSVLLGFDFTMGKVCSLLLKVQSEGLNAR